MTIGPEFKGKRANRQSVDYMKRLDRDKERNTELLNRHTLNLKKLDSLENHISRDILFRDFDSLYQKGTEILMEKYNKKTAEHIDIEGIYYQKVEGTGDYENVFTDGLIIEGTVYGRGGQKERQVLYLNDGFGERSYEIDWEITKASIFPFRFPGLKMWIPVEDGTKDRISDRKEVQMQPVIKKGAASFVWLEGEIEEIDSYGGARVTLVKVVDTELVKFFKKWQEDYKEDLKDKKGIGQIKKLDRFDYENPTESIEEMIENLDSHKNKIRGTAMAKIIKDALEIVNYKQRTEKSDLPPLPVDHEDREAARKSRKKGTGGQGGDMGGGGASEPATGAGNS